MLTAVQKIRLTLAGSPLGEPHFQHEGEPVLVKRAKDRKTPLCVERDFECYGEGAGGGDFEIGGESCVCQFCAYF